jgi:acetolactate synthase-1/3 small subunit
MGEQTLKMRHVLAAMVTNEPGVLAQVAGMFAARGFNIDSLVVGRTENPEISRMTIVVNGNDGVLEQVRKQLQKLVPVVKVVDYKSVPVVERDLLLLLVSTIGETSSAQGSADAEQDAQAANRNHRRSELIELANLFRAKVVDVGVDRLMIELSGTEDKIEAFIELARPYGILELARTGVIAMPRGLVSNATGTAPGTPDTGPSNTIDIGDLPPG